MKKILLISLIFSVFTVYAQQDTSSVEAQALDSIPTKDYCPHRIMLRLGTAYSNTIYKRIPENIQKYAVANVFEMSYAYFFTPNFGLGGGIGLSHIDAKALLNFSGQTDVTDDYYNNGGSQYSLLYQGRNFIERQNIWAIEIPIAAQFEYRLGAEKRHGIYGSIGIKGYFPISARTLFNGGELIFKGYDPALNVTYTQDLENHFGSVKLAQQYAKTKLRCSIDFTADFGGIIGISPKADLYIGAYLSAGMLSILPKEQQAYADVTEKGIKINGMLNSNVIDEYNKANETTIRNKWHVTQFGIKLGFNFKPCSAKKTKETPSNAPEIINNINVIIKDLPHDTVNVVVEKEIIIRDTITKQVQKAQEITQTLSETKIHFDLNSDKPNVSSKDSEAINNVAQMLKGHPDLKILVAGYTCKLGNENLNKKLALKRAMNVRALFLAKGVRKEQIVVESFTAKNYPVSMQESFNTDLKDARTVIFRVVTK